MTSHPYLVAPLVLLAVSVPATTAEPNADKPLPEEVTFSAHIAPIVYNNCTECHRPGEGAPFSLTSYKQVRKKAKTINLVVKDRYMPPWHPVPGWGRFRDDRRLADRDLKLIDRWVRTGMKRGDPAQEPKLPRFPEGWFLGQPDMVVKTREPYVVRAGGPDIYRNFVIPLNLKEDKWVTAVEIRPGARSVVHHCLFFLDSTGHARKLDRRDRTSGFRAMGFRRTGSLG
ncbi:MAG: hypothetical protein R3236_10850, partial [Phycisphaeraceae bacterium]|nr:hypothetical protein [Phycisphaeraceae bacterium]